MLSIILSVILSILSLGATEAPTQAPTQAIVQPVQAPITAPVQPLTYAAPTVTTQAATQAPTEVLTEAPIAAPIYAATEAPTQAPTCQEDMPCWDCETMGNLICGNPVCADLGLVTAEDLSCVPASFYTATAAPTSCPTTWYLFADGVCVDPSTLQPTNDTTEATVPENMGELALGDAWAGVGTHYSSDPAAAAH